MLTEVYGWFTEGFDMNDLQEAKAPLDELGAGAFGLLVQQLGHLRHFFSYLPQTLLYVPEAVDDCPIVRVGV